MRFQEKSAPAVSAYPILLNSRLFLLSQSAGDKVHIRSGSYVKASPQKGDLKLSGPLSGQGTGIESATEGSCGSKGGFTIHCATDTFSLSTKTCRCLDIYLTRPIPKDIRLNGKIERLRRAKENAVNSALTNVTFIQELMCGGLNQVPNQRFHSCAKCKGQKLNVSTKGLRLRISHLRDAKTPDSTSRINVQSLLEPIARFTEREDNPCGQLT
ncbi:hypothetical protein PoB_002084700 [Plakobranchus ocellatus]|uniref:Uncharacterized protein n=1 Tax=Plakobranchus ocellatus TaxID=259542 RepID=A0AAV3ZII2_9GAST|nr:hypothetical protein PoB_002084700 [Plakobranchus ocellatus]